jgi:hypothetical protein
MFLTHSSRAAADTILAQSRTSTRRLVPHAEHVRSRGRRCAPTTPTWPHVHAIWRSIPETQAASAGAGQAVSGQVRTMVIDWHGRRDRDGRFVALRCVRLLALRCVKAASPTGVPGRTLGTLFLPGATVRLDWPPLCFFQRYGWLLARRLGSTIFRNLAANSSRVSSGPRFRAASKNRSNSAGSVLSGSCFFRFATFVIGRGRDMGLLDHLVGASQQCLGYLNAHRLSGLEVLSPARTWSAARLGCRRP